MTADGAGVDPKACCEVLREPATATSLVRALGDALMGTYSGASSDFPGQVLTDLAVAIADRATSISG